MNKKVKVVFDPEFFEAFTGTQEELEQVMAEIRAEFENKTVEEIRAIAQPVEINEDDDIETKIAKAMYNKTHIPPTLQ